MEQRLVIWSLRQAFEVVKDNRLIAPKALVEMPAHTEQKHGATRPDDLWQYDGTNIFVIGWGYYKLIPVRDDFCGKILAHDIKGVSAISDLAEYLLENVDCLVDHLVIDGVAQTHLERIALEGRYSQPMCGDALGQLKRSHS